MRPVPRPASGRAIRARLLPALLLAALAGACTTTPTAPTASGAAGALTVGVASQGPVAAPRDIISAPGQALGATRFLAFGDSITAGVLSSFDNFFVADEAGSYPTLLRGGLNQYHQPQSFTVFNEGLPGETARQGLDRLPGVLNLRRPQVLMLLEGINDLNFGAGIEQTAANVRYMVDTARLFNCTVLLLTMPQTYASVYPNGTPRDQSADKIVPYNTELRRLVAGLQNVHVVDVYAAFGNDRSMMGNDGLHPSPAGYYRMAETVYNAIRATFPVRGSLQ